METENSISVPPNFNQAARNGKMEKFITSACRNDIYLWLFIRKFCNFGIFMYINMNICGKKGLHKEMGESRKMVRSYMSRNVFSKIFWEKALSRSNAGQL